MSVYTPPSGLTLLLGVSSSPIVSRIRLIDRIRLPPPPRLVPISLPKWLIWVLSVGHHGAPGTSRPPHHSGGRRERRLCRSSGRFSEIGASVRCCAYGLDWGGQVRRVPAVVGPGISFTAPGGHIFWRAILPTLGSSKSSATGLT